MTNFNSYFSDKEIIKHLCNKRICQANKVYELNYVARLACAREVPNKNTSLRDLLPPRSKWHSFRPKTRVEGIEPNIQALIKATLTLRLRTPNEPWAINLQQFITKLKSRVFSGNFTFSEPGVIWQLKTGHSYRALSNFSLEDSVVSSLLAKYLTDIFDPLFSLNSYAYRAPNKPIELNRDTAIENLFNYRVNNKKPLYVAECDIKGFFDSIAHEVAIKAFNRFKLQLTETTVDPIAESLFHSYLNCFSFPRSVLSKLNSLKTEDPKAECKWPAADLRKLWGKDPMLMNIGVPQGGAVSGIIANLVLDLADKATEQEGVNYFRYSDDSFISALNKDTCKKALARYLSVLDELKLPYHKPKRVWVYTSKFWDGKSKAPYKWVGRKWFGCIPWTQFLGYQIRYDGLMRVREESIKKEKDKIIQIIDTIKYGLKYKNKRGIKILSNKYQVLISSYHKLATTAVGKKRIGNDSPAPRCWVHGFKALNNKPIVKRSLQLLDSLREHQFRRLKRANIKYGEGKPTQPCKHKNLGDSDYSNSYFAQFKDNGGAKLVTMPYKPNWYEVLLEPIFNLAKKILK